VLIRDCGDIEPIVKLYVLNYFTSKLESTTALRETLERRRELKHKLPALKLK
jgi:hypothetical protein